MSGGFAQARTKAAGGLEREIEKRMKRLDKFTDVDADAAPGADTRKGSAQYNYEYQDIHTENIDDIQQEAEEKQEAMDVLDRMEQLIEGNIKKSSDQFPGKPKEKVEGPGAPPASDNASLDIHQVDPARLSLEDKVEAKMKGLKK